MSFRCDKCFKTVRTIADVRNCVRCQDSGKSASIPQSHSDSDWLTPALIGYALGGGFSSHSSAPADDTPSFSGSGGDTSGSGAGSSWSDDSSSGSSSDSSSSSSDSGSSDSGSSSSSDS